MPSFIGRPPKLVRIAVSAFEHIIGLNVIGNSKFTLDRVGLNTYLWYRSPTVCKEMCKFTDENNPTKEELAELNGNLVLLKIELL